MGVPTLSLVRGPRKFVIEPMGVRHLSVCTLQCNELHLRLESIVDLHLGNRIPLHPNESYQVALLSLHGMHGEVLLSPQNLKAFPKEWTFHLSIMTEQNLYNLLRDVWKF